MNLPCCVVFNYVRLCRLYCVVMCAGYAWFAKYTFARVKISLVFCKVALVSAHIIVALMRFNKSS